MELKPSPPLRLDLPEDFLTEFFCNALSKSFLPSLPESSSCHDTDKPALITIDLSKVLEWLETHELQSSSEGDVSETPVLLFAPIFSAGHLLLHYDGSPNATDLITKFISMFGNLIQESKATIISPSFIPKSKIREEQELIQRVASSISETSFIKFNFTGIGDFWAYAIRHKCTLLITTKDYQTELAKTLLHFYKGKIRSGFPSIYLSI